MHININVCFGSFLLNREMLGVIQQICAELAPSWSAKLHVYDSPNAAPMVPIGASDAPFDAVQADVSVQGPFYEKLVERFGPPKFTGVSGTVELRGSNAAITIIMNVDERRFIHFADLSTWGNKIAFQLRAKRIENQSAAEFAKRLFDALCSRLPVWYGHAESTKEFDAKNLSREGGGVAAIGVDFSKSLPGLYWLNYFGRECFDAIGPEKFNTIMAYRRQRLNDGIMLSAGHDPSTWAQPERASAEAEVMRALGEEYFFLRADPSRTTRSPFEVM